MKYIAVLAVAFLAIQVGGVTIYFPRQLLGESCLAANNCDEM